MPRCAQDRREDGGVVDVLARALRDPPGPATPSSIPCAARTTSSPVALVEQDEGGRVRAEDLGDALQELLQQGVEREVLQGGVGDALQRLERVRRPCAVH